MNKISNKIAQVFHGILTGIIIWIIGHLLSGRLSFVEDIELYPTGPLVFIFPFIVAVIFILISTYAAKKQKIIYYITSMICFIMPAVCCLAATALEFILELRIPVVSIVSDVLIMFLILPCTAMLSIMYQVADMTGVDAYGIYFIFVAMLYFLPVIVGMLISIKLYINKVRKY